MIEKILDEIKEFRHERKFHVAGLCEFDVKNILKIHPALFLPIYEKRTVNNIYFDNYNLDHYFSSIDGHSRRLKARIRWYGNLFGAVKKPLLELKYKQNSLIGKIAFPLKGFDVNENLSKNTLQNIFDQSSLEPALLAYLRELEYTLLNSYERQYYVSFNKKFRVTLDTMLSAYQLSHPKNNFLNHSIDRESVILEMKYDPSDELAAQEIATLFPFRLTKSSKYINGILQSHI